jgi:hypothetical protein
MEKKKIFFYFFIFYFFYIFLLLIYTIHTHMRSVGRLVEHFWDAIGKFSDKIAVL